MNKKELRKLLIAENIRVDWYSLDGELIPDRTVLGQSGNGWRVFYFGDRGEISEDKYFKSETEACEYLYKLLVEQRIKSNLSKM
jgi:hypothetical protein